MDLISVKVGLALGKPHSRRMTHKLHSIQRAVFVLALLGLAACEDLPPIKIDPQLRTALLQALNKLEDDAQQQLEHLPSPSPTSATKQGKPDSVSVFSYDQNSASGDYIQSVPTTTPKAVLSESDKEQQRRELQRRLVKQRLEQEARQRQLEEQRKQQEEEQKQKEQQRLLEEERKKQQSIELEPAKQAHFQGQATSNVYNQRSNSIAIETKGNDAKSSQAGDKTRVSVSSSTSIHVPSTDSANGTETEKPEDKEVKIFEAPLVAAFTLHHDLQGQPKSVVPLYQPPPEETSSFQPSPPVHPFQQQIIQIHQNQIYQQQLAEERERQRLRELEELKIRQIQEQNLARQRLEYEQQLLRIQQEELQRQKQLEIQKQKELEQLEYQRQKQLQQHLTNFYRPFPPVSDFRPPRHELDTQQQHFRNQVRPFAQPNFNQFSDQQNQINFQKSIDIGFQQQHRFQNSPLNVPNRNVSPQSSFNFAPPTQNFRNQGPIPQPLLPTQPSIGNIRHQRQEQGTGIVDFQKSVNSHFPANFQQNNLPFRPSTSPFSQGSSHFHNNFQTFPPRQQVPFQPPTLDKQYKNVLSQAGLSRDLTTFGAAPGEDLNILSKVLALDHANRREGTEEPSGADSSLEPVYVPPPRIYSLYS